MRPFRLSHESSGLSMPLAASVSTIGAAWDITPAPEAGSGLGLTCTSADILAAPGTGIPCAPRVFPAPAVPVPDAVSASPIDLGLNLGVAFTDDLDGLSYGEVVGVVAAADYDFSVDAAPANAGSTVGAPVAPACAPFVPNVTTEAAALEAQGDTFTTAGVPAGCNTQFTDEAALGLIAPNAGAPGVPPLDDVDALAEYDFGGPLSCTLFGGLGPYECGAFTVAAGSAVLGAIPPAPVGCFGAPADAATILVPPGTPNPGGFNPCMPPGGCPAGGTPCIALPFFALGLTGPGLNDIDALCWFDLNANGIPDLPLGLGPFGTDMYMFSLAPGSASVVGAPFFSPADILGYRGATPVPFTPLTVIRTAASLGLMATDNVDGLMCHQTDVDGDGIPVDLDNCPTVANPGQTNTDGDTPALGDACDPDDDNDGHWDTDETAKGSVTTTGLSTPEHCDGVDNDADAVLDEAPALSGRAAPDPLCADGADPDGDGSPNVADLDDDGDGFSDAAEQYMSTDELDDCRVVAGHDAWPPDASATGQANVGDVIILFGGGKILQNVGQPLYSRRSDANGNGQVNVGDVVILFGGGIILDFC